MAEDTNPLHELFVDQLKDLRLGAGPRDIEQARQRAALYAVKLLGRITGKIPT